VPLSWLWVFVDKKVFSIPSEGAELKRQKSKTNNVKRLDRGITQTRKTFDKKASWITKNNDGRILNIQDAAISLYTILRQSCAAIAKEK